MALKLIETQIDGRTVKIQQFAGVRGLTIKARLFKILLPAVGALLGGNSPQAGSPPQSFLENLGDLDLEKAFMRLAESVNPDDFTRLMLDLLSSTFIDDKLVNEAVFNDIFAGNYMMAYKIAGEVIKANGFFDFGAIGSLLQKSGLTGQPKKLGE